MVKAALQKALGKAATRDGDGARDFGHLVVQGTDGPGIVSAVTTILTEVGANIVSLDQHTDDLNGGRFFQRTVFDLPGLSAMMPKLSSVFEDRLSRGSGLTWRLTKAQRTQAGSDHGFHV